MSDMSEEVWPPALKSAEQEAPPRRRVLVGRGLAVAVLFNGFARYTIHKQFPSLGHVALGTELSPVGGSFWDDACVLALLASLLLCLLCTIYELIRYREQRWAALGMGALGLAVVFVGFIMYIGDQEMATDP